MFGLNYADWGHLIRPLKEITTLIKVLIDSLHIPIILLIILYEKMYNCKVQLIHLLSSSPSFQNPDRPKPFIYIPPHPSTSTSTSTSLRFNPNNRFPRYRIRWWHFRWTWGWTRIIRRVFCLVSISSVALWVLAWMKHGTRGSRLLVHTRGIIVLGSGDHVSTSHSSPKFQITKHPWKLGQELCWCRLVIISRSLEI